MAVTDPTVNYGWNLPTDQGDSGVWGVALRQIFGEVGTAGAAPNGGIDAILKAVSDVADAAMPKAGGVFTGEIDIFTARYEGVALGATLSGNVDLDLDAGNFFSGTMTGNIDIDFDGTVSDVVFFAVMITDDGGNAITWNDVDEWANGTQPTQTADGKDLYVFFTPDGGTTWIGARSMEDIG